MLTLEPGWTKTFFLKYCRRKSCLCFCLFVCFVIFASALKANYSLEDFQEPRRKVYCATKCTSG